MSEQGWREFLAADGVDDWVVLHGGATADFKVGSIGEAARLAAAVAEIDGFEGSGALLTVVDASFTVRLARGPLQLESRHVDLARAVSKVASAHGAIADRASVQEVQLAIASKPDAVDVGFWRAVLGYAPLADDACVDPLGHGSTVWMQELDEACHCGTRCTSTCRSRASTSRRGCRRRSLQAVASFARPMHHCPGRSPTARATACVFARGQTDPHRNPRLARRSSSLGTCRAANREPGAIQTLTTGLLHR
jgi:hypothetical protein